ncbi:MAG: molybdopterin-dependent oxidoreductase, partial [Actinomycetota bacterium]
HPPGWFEWPSRPAGLYRITQGVHVATGIASIPLLLAKLWVVYPHLWTWPPLRTVAHAVERISLFPLIAGALFLLVSGLNNTANWYPWAFFFPRAHYWAAWITIGALIVHVAAKLPVTIAAVRRSREVEPGSDGLSRRGFLGTVAAAVGAVTLATVGQTLGPLRRISLLAPRDPGVGPQGFPVNKSAASARVLETAVDPAYRLRIEGEVRRVLALTLDDLQQMPQHEATLPISCVEGWSAEADWRGVRVRDVLAMAGAPDGARVTVESLQPRGLYRASELNPSHAVDRDTLLAIAVNGEELHIDHGYPVRLIGPNRPGVMQTKWVSKLTVH